MLQERFLFAVGRGRQEAEAGAYIAGRPAEASAMRGRKVARGSLSRVDRFLHLNE
uniref:Uncharacterized protein n=1 Tax=Arundo donax TaxID=35708 RepID=A0A0A9I0P8_ARUDO